MKYVTCPKNETHRLFKRKVQVKAETWLYVDSTSAPLDIEPPVHHGIERHLDSHVYCSACGALAKVRLPF